LQAVRMRRPKLADDEVERLPDRVPDRQQARNLVEEVELALERLRDEYRQAFVLFHEHQLSYAEIAEALSCPVGTVKTWVHRARRELADHLRRRGVVEELPDALRRI
jgi:RNA polymerase sigma-70 factor (ECF subfamily)